MSAQATKRLIAVVTGGNKGIGYEICRHLATATAAADGSGAFTVLLAARDEQRGRDAVQSLVDAGVDAARVELLAPFDISDGGSVAACAANVKARHGGVDVLVNNAGIAFKGDAWGGDVARETVAVNCFGTVAVCDAFMPLLRPAARIVNVSSMSGHGALRKMSAPLRARFVDDAATLPTLRALGDEFVAAVAGDTYAGDGWPRSTYGVSKALVTAYTRLLARTLAVERPADGVVACAVCPGYCSTDMTSHRGSMTAAAGAARVCACITDARVRGGFYSDRKLTPFA
jgi:carbonyl reductase 1